MFSARRIGRVVHQGRDASSSGLLFGAGRCYAGKSLEGPAKDILNGVHVFHCTVLALAVVRSSSRIQAVTISFSSKLEINFCIPDWPAFMCTLRSMHVTGSAGNCCQNIGMHRISRSEHAERRFAHRF